MKIQGPDGVKDPELPGTDLDVTIEGSTATVENPDENAEHEWIEYTGQVHNLGENNR